MKSFLYNGHKVFYTSVGQGPTVVLVHGFGEGAAIWQRQVAHLQARFRLLVPCLPGTDPSDAIDDMSMEGLADCLHALLQAEGTGACALIGHSMGGYITLAFAERYPALLKGFGLFHSTAYADSAEKKGVRQKAIATIEKAGAALFLQSTTPNLYSPATKETAPSLIQEHLQSVRHFSGSALVAYYRAMMNRPDRTDLLKKTELPVLFVIGKHDTAVPMKDGLEQCHLPYFSYIHILNRSGHMGMVEEAEESNRLLTEYLFQTL